MEFEDPEDTKEAIDNMDKSELFGKVIKVSAAKPPKSVNEGLGSKTALWEQVSSFSIHYLYIFYWIIIADSKIGGLVGRECRE